MDIAVGGTVGLARTKRRMYKRLLERQTKLDQRAAEENAALREARQALRDEVLIPLRDVIQRLQHVDLLDEPAAVETSGRQ